MYVKIFLEVDKNRNVIRETIELVDTNIPRSKMYYEPIIDSALNAFLNPECSQLNLPKDKYQTWKNLTITFDYSMYWLDLFNYIEIFHKILQKLINMQKSRKESIYLVQSKLIY